ncbi:MAG: PRC-barrel domain-containing protein [Methanomassiliicoccales archaeon]|nr:PRC-barrel domain-containing protein [Methanomassiliicoccales archaeon]
MRVEDIIGDEVLSADAKVLGSVEGIGVDTESWKGRVLKIGLAKGLEAQLGVKKTLFGRSKFFVEVTYVESIADVITLSRKTDKLKEVAVDGSMIPTMAGDILLKRIVSSEGEQVGTVDELYFDEKRNWTMPYIQAKMTKELKKQFDARKFKAGLVKIPTVQVRTVGDVVMLDVSMQQLKDIIEHSPG